MLQAVGVGDERFALRYGSIKNALMLGRAFLLFRLSDQANVRGDVIWSIRSLVMSLLALCSNHRVLQEHGCCDSSHTPRDRCGPTSHRPDIFIVNVTHNAAITQLINTHVYDCSSRLHHVSFEEARYTDCHEDSLSHASVHCQVACEMVANRQCRALLQQQECDRLAYNLRGTNYRHVQASKVKPCLFQKSHCSLGCARCQISITIDDAAQRCGMHALNVFQWMHGMLHFSSIQMRGHRPLNDYACDARISVLLAENRMEFHPAHRFWQAEQLEFNSIPLCHLTNVLKIHSTWSRVANNNSKKTRRPTFCNQICGVSLDPSIDLLGDLATPQRCGSHLLFHRILLTCDFAVPSNASPSQQFRAGS
mmetsp:Transcript_129300/g.241819  ORF Transcript_129300/g.241819 Transcript_129300/m.241819 type:complete len:365 (-) Transcript_129300:90-1184(-)